MRPLLACCVAVFFGSWLMSSTAAEPPAKASQIITLEILMADAPEGAEKSPPAAKILEMEKARQLSSTTRFKVTTLEGQKASLQFNELVPVVTGYVLPPGGKMHPQYTDVRVGTMLSAMPRLADDGTIEVTLKITRARVVPPNPPAAGADVPGNFKRQSTATVAVESTVKVRPGEPTLIGGQQVVRGDDATQTWFVITAHVGVAVAAGTSPKPAPGGAALNQIKVFQLRYASAEQLAAVLNQVFAGAPVVITADPRSNAILVRGPTERLTVVSGLLNELDSRQR